MKKIIILAGLILSMSPVVDAAETVHWDYDSEDVSSTWGKLSPQYQLCATGKNQSPINITAADPVKNKHKLKIEYEISPHDILFNGHTIQVNTQDQSDYMVLDQDKFYLKQFHFHTPSENQIHAKSYPMEVHFVNQNEHEQLTVLAVMFELGKENREWKSLWRDLSPQENQDKVLSKPIDLDDLLPKQRDYYRTTGSLTTPPCTEGVNWIIFKHPISISAQQLEDFKALLKHHANNRQIQPSNNRVILDD